MFGMGFMEIFLIAIVAIVALGPDKLPTAMVEVAKFIKKFKSGVEDAKTTLDTELNIKDMKEEANKFKAHKSTKISSVRKIDGPTKGIRIRMINKWIKDRVFIPQKLQNKQILSKLASY